MNPNHPHYAGLGGGPNLNLLDNMLMAAGFPATDQPRSTIVPQYTYAQVTHAQDVASMHHHAMNLVQPHTTVAASDPVHVIVYQNEHQQQPISYKIPQLGTTVTPQDQTFVVNDQGGQISRQQNVVTQANVSRASDTSIQIQTSQTVVRHVQSPAERKKDIVAQAMQEQKIFEENIPKAEPPVVKQEPGLSTGVNAINNTVTTAPTTTSTSTVTENNATETTVTAETKPELEKSPIVTTSTTTPTTTPTTPTSGQRRPYQRTNNYSRQQVMPRLQILDDEDDGLTCRLCLASYWYKAEIYEHLKSVHSISDPEKYEREEREKKARRIREEQQRILLAKKQREERERRLREAKFGRGRGTPGTIKLTSPGVRPSQSPGQRPSFQYRDGAFICDLCKESFSDGNDMVTHWKSHVRKQQAEAAKNMRGGRGGAMTPSRGGSMAAAAAAAGRGGRGGGRGRGRGRPPVERETRKSKKDESEDDDDDDESPRKTRGSSKKNSKKGAKGTPRWTAYLLWSTRKRRDVVIDHPDWSFAQVAKWISDEWKKIDTDEKDELQKEAEEMNELGIRKLPRDDDSQEKDTTEEDSDFEEGYRKKTKPIMLKIKKEKRARSEGKSAKLQGKKVEKDTDESDWEPEAEVMPPMREKTRSGRQRKRPSFFQEFESQETNLDNMLDQFEKEQAQEFGKPKQPKPAKKSGGGEKRTRKRRAKSPEPDENKEPEVEVETLRSGRKRKVRRVMTTFIEGSDDDEKVKDGSSDDDFEPTPEDVEKLEGKDEKGDDDELLDDELEDEDDDDEERLKHPDDTELPPKKRGRPKKILTDEEIEEATKAALGKKPRIEITRVPVPEGEEGKENGEEEATEPEKGEEQTEAGAEVEGEAAAEDEAEANAGGETETSAKNAEEEEDDDESKAKPAWMVNETLSDSENEEGKKDGEKNGHEMEGDSAPAAGDEGEKSNLNTAMTDDVDADAGNEVEGVPNDLDQLDAASAELDGLNPDDDKSMSDNNLMSAINQMEVENTIESVTKMLGEEEEIAKGAHDADSLAKASDPAQTMTEDDLLSGSAHNLDDSQYKPDIVDPNLDDIFK